MRVPSHQANIGYADTLSVGGKPSPAACFRRLYRLRLPFPLAQLRCGGDCELGCGAIRRSSRLLPTVACACARSTCAGAGVEGRVIPQGATWASVGARRMGEKAGPRVAMGWRGAARLWCQDAVVRIRDLARVRSQSAAPAMHRPAWGCSAAPCFCEYPAAWQGVGDTMPAAERAPAFANVLTQVGRRPQSSSAVGVSCS